jgi:hypothetical protein
MKWCAARISCDSDHSRRSITASSLDLFLLETEIGTPQPPALTRPKEKSR